MKFNVTISRTCYSETDIVVEAKDEAEADELGRDIARNTDFSGCEAESDTSVEYIERIESDTSTEYIERVEDE